MKKLYLLLFLLPFLCNAQMHSNWSSGNIFKTDYFIENKGQFTTIQHQVNDVQFALMDRNDEVYFTTTGFQFHLHNNRYHTDSIDKWIGIEWLNTSPSVEIIPEEKSTHYFTYGSQALNSYGYKKLRYNNIYKGITLLVELHPKGGIKYSFVVDKAADISQIKYRFIGNKKTDITLLNNEISVVMGNDTLLEKQLIAADEQGTKINIAYNITDDEQISYHIENTYSTNKIIIDPWVVAATSLTGIGNTANKGYDVDYDYAGNLYVYGGGYDPSIGAYPNLPCFNTAKYDVTGNLLWTFAGFVTSLVPTWYGNGQASNFIVDKTTQKVYVGGGTSSFFYWGSIIRLNTAGVYDNFINVRHPFYQFTWDMQINCNTGDIIGLGGGAGQVNFVVLDTTTGSMIALNITGVFGGGQDVVSSSINKNGECYLTFMGNSIAARKIFKINSNYNSSIWSVPSGYNVFKSFQNKPYASNNTLFSNGFNALACNLNYIFYYDGFHIGAFTSSNGSVASRDSIIGHVPLYQGGIYADECNHVYVGGDSGNIKVFTFNGSSFIPQPDIVLGGVATGRHIYDMRYSSGNNLLYISGDSFVATVTPTFICNDTNIKFSTHLACANQSRIEANINQPNATSTYTFIWADSATNAILKSTLNPSNFTDTISGLLSNHVYKLTIIQNAACGGPLHNYYFKIDTLPKYSIYFQYDTICANQSFSFNLQTLTQSGIYNDTFTSYLSCDSIIQLHLTVKSVIYDTLNDTICQPNTYYFNQYNITTTGVYFDTLYYRNGCDSLIIRLNLIVKKQSTKNIVTSICNNQTYTLPKGKIVSIGGTYIDTLVNYVGCDSIITTILTVKNTSTKNITASICSNQIYTLPKGKIVSIGGIYIDTLLNYVGCDSIITNMLSVKNASTKNITASICNHQTYTLPKGKIVSIGGTYIDTLLNYVGCDSIITTILSVKNTSTKNITASICSNQTYTLPKGKIVSIGGVYKDTLTNYVGCDSIITTTLSVKNTSTKSIAASICSNQTYTLPKGKLVSVAGLYKDTVANAVGCDSIISIQLSVNNISNTTISKTICSNQSYFFNNQILTTSGTYYDTLINKNGCDSIISLQLSVHSISNNVLNEIICSNQFYTLPNGTQVSKQGIYKDTLLNISGCDSFVTINLSVIDLPHFNLGNDTNLCAGNTIILSVPQYAAASYLWNTHSTNYTINVDTSGFYYVTVAMPPCASVSDSVKINFMDCDCKVLLPNSFTPNNDGLDETFKPILACDVEPQQYEFKIYNRLGQKVFSTTLYNIAWDGTFNGTLQEVGTYVFFVSFINPTTQQKEFYKGDVILLR